jgi:hypothetical protein
MAESHSVYALHKKRDDIRRAIRGYEVLIQRAQRDLAHINATLKLFEATGKPSNFPSYVDLARVFRRGETTTICLDALRAEGSLDTRQLTLRVMRAKGLDENDTILRNAVSFRVIHVMRRHAAKRIVTTAGKRHCAFVWQLCTFMPSEGSYHLSESQGECAVGDKVGI